jgi:hypothetical protein
MHHESDVSNTEMRIRCNKYEPSFVCMWMVFVTFCVVIIQWHVLHDWFTVSMRQRQFRDVWCHFCDQRKRSVVKFMQEWQFSVVITVWTSGKFVDWWEDRIRTVPFWCCMLWTATGCNACGVCSGEGAERLVCPGQTNGQSASIQL